MKRVQNTPLLWLVLIQFVLAYQWLNSGLDKFTQPGFMSNINKTIGLIIGKTRFDWYGNFLDRADPVFWGNLVRFSEMVLGLGLLMGGIYVLQARHWPRKLIYLLAAVLFSGALLNLNFYLAAGWDSKAVSSLNLIMAAIQAILAAHYLRTLKR